MGLGEFPLTLKALFRQARTQSVAFRVVETDGPKFGFVEHQDFESYADLSSPDLASPKARADRRIKSLGLERGIDFEVFPKSGKTPMEMVPIGSIYLEGVCQAGKRCP